MPNQATWAILLVRNFEVFHAEIAQTLQALGQRDWRRGSFVIKRLVEISYRLRDSIRFRNVVNPCPD